MNIKTINKSILFIAIALFLVSGNNAFAYVPGVWDPQPRVQTNEPAFYKVPNPYDAPVVPQVNSTSTNTNSNQNTTTNSNTTKTVATTTTTKKVATNTQANNKLVSTTKADVREIPPVVIDNSGSKSGSELTALSLAGSGSFMPSSIWQWIIVVILILAIIILFRIISRPHAHDGHEVHH